MLRSLLVCLGGVTAAVSSSGSSAPAFPSPANGTAYSAAILELARAHHKGRVNAHQLVNATAGRPPVREFPCTPWDTAPRKGRRALNVHELQPADIAAVGALGDSVTAGFGARASSLIDLAVEARGASWSIGGDDDVSTLPNFLKVFNPSLAGFSEGNGNAGRGFGDASISGAVSPGMLGQATTLAANMEREMGPDAFREEWKLVTVWIGGNDICSRGTSAQEYIEGIEAALDYLQQTVPRLFVNLVTMVDVGSLYDITGSDIGCLLVRPTVCSRGSNRERSAQEAADYQAGIAELALAEKYEDDDFAVVSQPWYTNFEVVDNVDRSYLSPDCFHYHTSAMEFAALATWNNLFQPVGEKQLSYLVGEPITCPSPEQPFFFTNRNSRSDPKP